MSCSSASDALLYERLCSAEREAWEFVKAVRELDKQANEELEACTTAKRMFEESLMGEEKHERRTYC